VQEPSQFVGQSQKQRSAPARLQFVGGYAERRQFPPHPSDQCRRPAPQVDRPGENRQEPVLSPGEIPGVR
jgi:hypothetical protein